MSVLHVIAASLVNIHREEKDGSGLCDKRERMRQSKERKRTYNLKAENFIESHNFFPSPPRAVFSWHMGHRPTCGRDSGSFKTSA